MVNTYREYPVVGMDGWVRIVDGKNRRYRMPNGETISNAQFYKMRCEQNISDEIKESPSGSFHSQAWTKCKYPSGNETYRHDETGIEISGRQFYRLVKVYQSQGYVPIEAITDTANGYIQTINPQESHNKPPINLDNVRVGKCEICEKDTNYLVLDHDHKTGLVRGNLCRSCNTKLGHIESQGMAPYINYLAKYKSIDVTITSSSTTDLPPQDNAKLEAFKMLVDTFTSSFGEEN